MLPLITQQLRKVFPDGVRGIIFDCDGVIIDSNHVNLSYYNMVLKELGYPEIAEEHRDYVQMASWQEAIDFLIPKKDHGKLTEILKHRPYEKESLPYFTLEPGLMELLQWLRNKGINIGLHTNRDSDGVYSILEHLGIADFFHMVMHIDIVPAKPHPGGTLKILEAWNVAASAVAFVGDSLTDEGVTSALEVPLISYRNKKLAAAIFIENFMDLHQAFCKVYT